MPMTDRELMQQSLGALEANLGNWAAKTKAIAALRDRLAQPEQERPSFAKWTSDYVQDNLHKLKPEHEQWDAIPDAFNEWWNADYDDTGNPFRKDSPAYWAWSGWKAASKQPEQESVFDCPRCGHCCPQRKPLTDEECDDLWAAQLFDITDRVSARDFIRDVEAAHGIKENT